MAMYRSFICLISFLFSIVVDATHLVTIPKTGVTYRGGVLDSIEHFGNIKYAHDTSGARRFSPPESFTPVSGTEVDASARGPACPQVQWAMPPFFDIEPEISEDCLNLRIARPENVDITSESKLPVVVWIHGGGVVKGSAYDPHFDPTKLLKLSASTHRPIIYAAINYRLTIFGFPRSQTLKDNKSLNLGLRDQRLALQWIKDNISAFGGDPEKITVYGLSSGGTFASLNIMAYGGEKGVPFQQAWVMSGPPSTALNLTSDATELHTLAVAEKTGCGKLEDAEMIECLRKIPLEELLGTAMKYSMDNHPPAGLFTFIPSVDNDFLPDRQSNLVRDGKFVKGIRMVYGWTKDDGAMNVGMGDLVKTEAGMIAPIKQFAHGLSSEQYSKLFSLYPPEDFDEELDNYLSRAKPSDPEITVHYFRVSRILRDILFTCSSIDFGSEMVKQTRASLDPNFGSVRLYEFNQSMFTHMWAEAGMPYIGISHGSDTNYIFNGLFPEGEVGESDLALSEMFSKSLINFAYTGDPNGSGKHSQGWPEAVGKSRDSEVNIQVIGGPYGTGSVSLKQKKNDEGEGIVGEQKILSDNVQFGEMGSPELQMRQRQIEQAKLFERCEYIRSLAESLGV
ncbi:Alpha/Beta hydrolase protein [Bisporella sp. PMI_857]|nr:Alpha/Beta hydrolase protein [Bisporella sp. PMI_857]